jgi:hypothetical protein
MIKDRECIHCKKFFECKGKESKNPCLHFEERKKDSKDGRI